jgi:probable HAF family extracellular repeat protein
LRRQSTTSGVGQSTHTASGTDYHAFVYSNGKMQDLNSLITPIPGWTLITAFGINDAGQIVGYMINNSDGHVFLLTPE